MTFKTFFLQAQYIFIHEALSASLLSSLPVPVEEFSLKDLLSGETGARLIDREYKVSIYSSCLLHQFESCAYLPNTHTHRRARARTHTHTQTRARTHTHTYARTHARTHTLTHARTHARTRTHTHAHTHTHTRTHTRAHTHTHTHTAHRHTSTCVWSRAELIGLSRPVIAHERILLVGDQRLQQPPSSPAY